MRLKLLISVGLISSILSGCGDIGNNQNLRYADTNISSKQLEAIPRGSLIYYKITPNDPVSILATNQRDSTIKSTIANHPVIAATLIANLKVNQTGLHYFPVKHAGVEIRINNELVNNQKILLNKQEIIPLEVIYTSSSDQVESIVISWIEPNRLSTDQNPATAIPVTNLLLPNSKDFHKISLRVDNQKKCVVKTLDGDLNDSSCNGIPDIWAVEGYTVIQENKWDVPNIAKWDDAYKGFYPKYYSNHLKWSTASDPYSDFQKVTGMGLDSSVTKEARNPLIAAYPIIIVNPKGLIISNLNHVSRESGVSEGKSTTISSSISNGSEDSTGSSDSAGGRASVNFPWSASVEVNYEHQWSSNHSTSNNVSNENSSGNNKEVSISQTISLNEGEAARISPIVSFINIGTAGAYKVEPSYNFINSKSKTIFASIYPISGREIAYLNPGQIYPKDGNGIAINAIDTFGAKDITINKDQLNELDSNRNYKVSLLQFDAQVKTYTDQGTWSTENNSWNNHLSEIEDNTALIRVTVPEEIPYIERRVAAKRRDLEYDSTPEIDFENAISLSTGFRLNQDGSMENSLYHYQNIGIKIFDADEQNTQELEHQFDRLVSNNGRKNIAKLKLSAKFGLMVYPTGIVFNKKTKTYYFYDKNGQQLTPEVLTVKNNRRVLSKLIPKSDLGFISPKVSGNNAENDLPTRLEQFDFNNKVKNQSSTFKVEVFNQNDSTKHSLWLNGYISSRNGKFWPINRIPTSDDAGDAQLVFQVDREHDLPPGRYIGGFDLLGINLSKTIGKQIRVNIDYVVYENNLATYLSDTTAAVQSIDKKHMYFFLKNKTYIKYNLDERRIVKDYPRKIDKDTWPEVGDNLVLSAMPIKKNLIGLTLSNNDYMVYDLINSKVQSVQKIQPLDINPNLIEVGFILGNHVPQVPKAHDFGYILQFHKINLNRIKSIFRLDKQQTYLYFLYKDNTYTKFHDKTGNMSSLKKISALGDDLSDSM